MKNLGKLIGIIAVAAVIVFSMAACGNGSTDGGKGGGKKLPSLESEHFIIKCVNFEEDEDVLFKLRDKLEGNYGRITTALNVGASLPETEKSIFRLYPSQSSYSAASGYGGGVVGNHYSVDFFWYGSPITIDGVPQEPIIIVQTTTGDDIAIYIDEIRMVTPGNPPANNDFNSMLKVAVHEFVHLVTGRVYPHFYGILPFCLDEGVAVYLAGQGDNVRSTIAPAITNGTFPASLNAIPSGMSSEAYNYAYAFVEYVVSKYDYDGLVKLIKSVYYDWHNDVYHDVDFTCIGTTEAQFMSEWKTYCTNKYK
jgi:hypothetical protein